MSDYVKFMAGDNNESAAGDDLREEFFDDDNIGLL